MSSLAASSVPTGLRTHSSILLKLGGAVLAFILSRSRWDSPVSRSPSLLQVRLWGVVTEMSIPVGFPTPVYVYVYMNIYVYVYVY